MAQPGFSWSGSGYQLTVYHQIFEKKHTRVWETIFFILEQLASTKQISQLATVDTKYKLF